MLGKSDAREAEAVLLDLLGDGIGSRPSRKKAHKAPKKRYPKPKKPKPEKLTPQQIAERFLEKVRRNEPHPRN